MIPKEFYYFSGMIIIILVMFNLLGLLELFTGINLSMFGMIICIYQDEINKEAKDDNSI